jgi:hypothetical protein
MSLFLEGHWREAARGRHSVEFRDLTGSQLRAAITWRREQAELQLKIADLWQRLADQLADNEPVHDRFTEADIDTLFRD